jgi:hypothetical protein
LQKGEQRPVQRRLARAVGAKKQQVAPFQLKLEFSEGIEVGDFEVLQPRFHTAPSR